MHTHYSSKLRLLLVALTSLHILLQPTVGLAAPKFNFDGWRNQAKAEGFTGSVMVAYKNEVILQEGFGLQDRENTIPFSEHSAFDIMSITKQFTAAGIMKLNESNKLKLTDTLAHYFDQVPSDKKDITIHQLLTHWAGFRSSFKRDYKVVTQEDLIAGAFSKRLKFKPGSQYDYSNVGYSLLAIIIEKASGQPYEKYLHDQLFFPLGMHSTGYRIPQWESKDLIVGYKDMIPYAGRILRYTLPLLFQSQRWGNSLEQNWDTDGPWWNLRGNGGMISTMGDMLIWHKALQTDGVLTKASLEEIFTPHVAENKEQTSFYGYGWAMTGPSREKKVIFHDGGYLYFYALMERHVDDDVLLFYVTNNQRESNREHYRKLRRIVFRNL